MIFLRYHHHQQQYQRWKNVLRPASVVRTAAAGKGRKLSSIIDTCSRCVYNPTKRLSHQRRQLMQQPRPSFLSPFLVRNFCYTDNSNAHVRQRRYWYHDSQLLKTTTPIRTLSTRTTSYNYDDDDEAWLLQQAMSIVQQYDPGAYLPGYVVLSDHEKEPNIIMLRTAYYALRAFWIETGLRYGSTAYVSPNSTPYEHVQWWKAAIHSTLFPTESQLGNVASSSTDPTTIDEEHQQLQHERSYHRHPTIRLLLLLQNKYHVTWSQQYFDQIINARCKDLDVKQYATMHDLIHYAEQSCGSVTKLLLESAHIHPNNMHDDTNNNNTDVVYEAARLVGIGHGLSNALRQSVVTLSIAGKLIIPHDIQMKYNVASPRYLLSALSMGDTSCENALQQCVQEIAITAQDHINQARTLRDKIITQQSQPQYRSFIVPCLLVSTIPSEQFLLRLQQHDYKLTDRNLRHGGIINTILEPIQTMTKTLSYHYQNKY